MGFTLKSKGQVDTIKLVHTSGYVSCRTPSYGRSNWGCGGDHVSIAITDSSNALVFPKGLSTNGWIKIPNYTSKSKELVLTSPISQPANSVGLRLWYGEDLKGFTEGDNNGRSCVDIYAKTTGISEFDGTWDVAYWTGAKATYKITGEKVTVLSCTFHCKAITESILKPSDDQARYPSADGWMKVAPIHRSDTMLYMRMMEDHTLKVNYFSNAWKYPTLPKKTSGINRCSLPRVVGRCRMASRKYYYDSASNSCKTFFYGGCGGNLNQFSTLDLCRQYCT